MVGKSELDAQECMLEFVDKAVESEAEYPVAKPQTLLDKIHNLAMCEEPSAKQIAYEFLQIKATLEEGKEMFLSDGRKVNVPLEVGLADIIKWMVPKDSPYYGIGPQTGQAARYKYMSYVRSRHFYNDFNSVKPELFAYVLLIAKQLRKEITIRESTEKKFVRREKQASGHIYERSSYESYSAAVAYLEGQPKRMMRNNMH